MKQFNFLKLSKAKQKKIILAGFQCFAKSGYDKTSIAEIAKLAGISKASIFHYFETKKNLYNYLYKESCSLIADNIVEGNDDLFETITIGTISKFEVMKQYPYMYQFLISTNQEENQIIKNELSKLLETDYKRGSEILFKNINWNKLKLDITPQTALELIIDLSQGYLKEVSINEDSDLVVKKLNVYLEILKRAIYKEDYL
ncbi:MAG: TetR/AcrR family transcriptional regulator [Erysipelotrichaceae bacterium]